MVCFLGTILFLAFLTSGGDWHNIRAEKQKSLKVNCFITKSNKVFCNITTIIQSLNFGDKWITVLNDLFMKREHKIPFSPTHPTPTSPLNLKGLSYGENGTPIDKLDTPNQKKTFDSG